MSNADNVELQQIEALLDKWGAPKGDLSLAGRLEVVLKDLPKNSSALPPPCECGGEDGEYAEELYDQVKTLPVVCPCGRSWVEEWHAEWRFIRVKPG